MIITMDTDLVKLSKALETILASAPTEEPDEDNETDTALYEVAQLIREALA